MKLSNAESALIAAMQKHKLTTLETTKHNTVLYPGSTALTVDPKLLKGLVKKKVLVEALGKGKKSVYDLFDAPATLPAETMTDAPEPKRKQRRAEVSAPAEQPSVAEPTAAVAPAPVETTPEVEVETEDSEAEVKQLKMPELHALYLSSDKAPVSGLSHYFVLARGRHTVNLFHPFTLATFTVPLASVDLSKETLLDGSHGFAAERLADAIEKKAKHMAALKKGFNGTTVRRVIAALRGVPLEDVEPVKETPKVDPAVVKERVKRMHEARADKGPGVIDHIRELISRATGASKAEIMARLQENFPNKPEKGLAKTLSNQLSYFLRGNVTETIDAKRGKVYHWNGKETR